MAVFARERAEVDSMIPSLENARKAGNKAAYRSLAIKIGAKSGEIIATVKAIPTDSASRALLGKLIDEALSDNHH